MLFMLLAWRVCEFAVGIGFVWAAIHVNVYYVFGIQLLCVWLLVCIIF